MQLYYSPGACSMAPHIMACEAGVPLTLVKVDLAQHRTEDGRDYYAINPLGYVPFLVEDDGTTRSEASSLTHILARRGAGHDFIPPEGSEERDRLMETMAYISTELHKGFGPLFSKDAPDSLKQQAREKLPKRFQKLETMLGGGPFVLGERFTPADAYLFVMLSWADKHKLDLSALPKLAAYKQRIAARPKVQQALREEGLA